MPRIPDFLLDSAIYLYESKPHASSGDSAGGSGFLVGVPMQDDARFPYWRTAKDMAWMQQPNNMFGIGPWSICAVTAKHVIGEGFPVARLNSVAGGSVILPLTGNDWIPHPDGDDITVCPLDLPAEMRVGFVPAPFLLTSEQIYKDDIGPGNDVFFVGRFIAQDGKERNTPTVRFGNIARMPFEPVENPKTGLKQQSFLVEMRSLPGYSGSPVFVYSPHVTVEVDMGKIQRFGMHWKGPASGEIVSMHRIYLLGIDWCHFKSFTEVLEENRSTPHPEGTVVAQNTGMAGVVPAWTLLDILDSEEMVELRKKRQADHKDRTANVQLGSTRREPPGTLTKEEFDAALRKVTRRVESPKKER